MSHCKTIFLLVALFLMLQSYTFSQSNSNTDTLYNEAVELYEDGDHSEAKEIFEEISGIVCSEGRSTEKCIDLKIYLSDIARWGRNFEYAENNLFESERILNEKLHTPHPLQMELYMQMVFLYSDMTNFEEGERVVDRLFELSENPVMEGMPRARAYLASGYLEDARGNLHRALESYTGAVEAVQGIDRDREVLRFLAVAYNNMGVLTRRIGEVREAMNYFQQALEVTKSLYGENNPEVALLYNSIGTIHYVMGDFGQAAEYFLSSGDIFRENYGENHNRVATAYNNAGVVYTEMDEIERAAEILEKAQRIKENLFGENHIDTAIGYSNLASIYMETENYDAALSNYQKSIAVRKEIYGEDHLNLITPYINIGEFYTRTEEYGTAREFFGEALQITEKRLGENHPYVWDVLLNVGNSYKEEENFESALENYQEAYDRIVRESGIASQNGFDAGRLSHPLLFMKAASNIGDMYIKLYEKEGGVDKLHQAIENYFTSIRVVDYLQYSYQSEASKLNLVDQNYSIFTNSIKAYSYLYQETGEKSWLDEILTISELSRSRIALELLQDIEAKNFSGVPQEILDEESTINTQIADFYQRLNAEQEKGLDINQDSISAYRDSLFASRRRLNNLTDQLETNYPDYYRLKYDHSYANREAVVDLLEADEALVNYIVSDEEVFALVLDQEDIRFHTLGSTDSLSTWIKSLRNSVLSDSSAQYSELATKLYDQLMEPVLSDLDSNSLIIVPDQSLHYLPFEMLLTEKPQNSNYYDFSYLVRDYQISYVPSATVLQMLTEQKVSNPQNLFAVAPFNDSSMQITEQSSATRYITDLSPLPLTRYETNQIAKIFNEPQTWTEYIFPEDVTVVLGKEAKKSTIESTSFNDYGFLHFATHAFVNEGDPTLSGIAFWGEENEDGIIYVNDIYNMKLDADLVVLGACETGLGTVFKGEGIIGFTRAFIYAGASNLMVSMWKVNDQPTATLMIEFYRYVKEGHSYAEALQMAKLDLINQPEFAAPRNWAAFILQGR